MITDDRRRRPATWLVVAALQVLVITLAGSLFSVHWAPEPHSDWLLYWNSAGDPGAYERGGAGLWFLAVPKALGMAPHAAALALNLPAAAWLCVLGYRADHTRFRLFAQLMVAYLLLITPYFGIVQLDLVGAALLATGFWLLMDACTTKGQRSWRMVVAVFAVAAAVSTRPQYALVLWALLVLLMFGWLVGRRWSDRRLRFLVIGLLLGSVVGFGLDMGLRQASGQAEKIRTSSAVTLYAGLLVSADTRAERCGQWTPGAADAAREDLPLPLAEAIGRRIASRPAADWAGVLACKAPRIVVPPAYALYWLQDAPNVAAMRMALERDGKAEAGYALAIEWEDRVFRLLGLAILLACAWTIVRGGRSRRLMAVLVPLAWIGAFWGVHAVFEIQGRYFLALYLIAPLLCAMVWVTGPGRSRPGGARLAGIGPSGPG
ncbi:MAG: hypothetical protein ACTHZI_08095 [Luteimonas sp.]